MLMRQQERVIMKIIRKIIPIFISLMLLGSLSTMGASHSHEPRHARGVFEAEVIDYAGATGHVILNYARGKDYTIVQVNLRGLQPNTQYWFNLTHGRPAVPFWTRRNGTANLHYELDGDHAGHLPAYVYSVDTTGMDPEDEVDYVILSTVE